MRIRNSDPDSAYHFDANPDPETLFLTQDRSYTRPTRVYINNHVSSLGRYVFGSEISYNKAPPRLPGLGC